MIITDPKMPFINDAMDIAVAQRQLNEACPQLAPLRLLATRLVRHKAGRRCLIEYDVESAFGVMTLIGKARAKGLDERTFALMIHLRKVGFGDDNSNGISVPEPIGVIPAFSMWLQCKVPGVAATQLLPQPDAAQVAFRVAEAIWKLHQSAIPTDRQHSLADEVAALDYSLMTLARQRTKWGGQLTQVLRQCRRLVALIPQMAPGSIHRDFYADQLLIDGPRVYLLDFDLFCRGDPMLDVGNFIGHLVEQAVRLGDAEALAERAADFAERYSELTGRNCLNEADSYATLTLARHIAISARMPERRKWTPRLLELCEERLGLRSISRPKAFAV